MRNLVTLGKRLFHSSLGWSISLLLGFGLTTSLGSAVRAESPETAPQELKEILSEIETAVNSRDLEGMMQFYSPNFTNSDGLSHSSLSQALTELWKRYPSLNYMTELQSWERVGDELVAETVTYIRGTENIDGRLMRLDSNIRSRQYFKDQKLVRQEILAERTKLTSGENPPEVNVILPEKVGVGEQFNFDVIVKEPLRDDVLLGAAIEEQTSSDRYFNPSTLELEILPAGGIFKLVTAPLLPDNRWLSAILVHADGIILITQRVRVEN
ncbi:MAG: nuclear transport factor 2 family protein [Xenococcaceae cyanobacterium]